VKHYWLALVSTYFPMAQFHGVRQMVSRDFCFSATFCLGFSPPFTHAIPELFVCAIHIPVVGDITALTSETTFELSCSGSGNQPTAVDGVPMVQGCLP